MLEQIYCVDDDVITLMLCKKVIQRADFAKEILTATNGEEAILFFKELAEQPAPEYPLRLKEDPFEFFGLTTNSAVSPR